MARWNTNIFSVGNIFVTHVLLLLSLYFSEFSLFLCVCMPFLVWLFLLQAYKMGMYGADYAWILHEIVGPPWWKEGTVDCYQKQLEEASENLLVVSSHNSIVGGAISYSGLVRSIHLLLSLFCWTGGGWWGRSGSVRAMRELITCARKFGLANTNWTAYGRTCVYTTMMHDCTNNGNGIC